MKQWRYPAMRKLKFGVFLAILAIMVAMPATIAFARVGQIGFFGGITEGVRLPLTTDILLTQPNTGNAGNFTARNLVYKEMLWLGGGEPVEFEGLIDIIVTNTRGRNASEEAGTRTVRYIIRPSAMTAAGVSLNRNILFNVNWHRVGNQIVETYTVASWTETQIINGQTFTIDATRSGHQISVIRDITPGVTYYRGDVSMEAVFNTTGGSVTHMVIGEIYGFESAWAATETHRLNGIVIEPTWQMQYQLVPSVAVSKELEYSQNEPTLISFFGNYREITHNQSGLNYLITVMPNQFYGQPTAGRTTIRNFNRFEQLIAPNLTAFRGHPAYQDVRRLYAMQIIDVRTTPPEFFPLDQAINRAEFFTMLARAIKLPVDDALLNPPAPRNNRPVQVNLLFPDLWPNRWDYAFLRAVNDAGIAVGRGDGHFHPDLPITRQEAYVTTLRSLGLSILGLDIPIAPFADSHNIAYWAMNDINAAARIGLISPDENGNLHPQQYMTRAQAVALINHLLEYMRHELLQDYTENIINFMN